MKLITAIVRESKFEQVHEALTEAGVARITATRVSGHGRGMTSQEEFYRGQKIVHNLMPKMRIDVAVNDNLVEPAIEAILHAAKDGDEGAIGDGKIFVTPLEQCIRIRTGERGPVAL